MKEIRLIGTTSGAGAVTVISESAVFGYLARLTWVDGDLADGVDAVLSVINTSAGVNETLYTLTDANEDTVIFPGSSTTSWPSQVIVGTLSLAITSGGSAKTGGMIVYISPVPMPAAAILTGEAHIGEVGGNTLTPSFTPVLTVAGIYAANDYVGTSASTTAITAARINAGSGWVISACLLDYALRSIAMECWLFNAAITPPADNAAWTLSDADLAKLVCIIPFNTYYASALNSASPGVPIGSAAFTCPAGVKTLYPYLVTRGAPTYATGDLTVIFSIEAN